MDHTQSNPTLQHDLSDQIAQPPSIPTLESLLPTANANQLLELIDQGHNPNDLHKLIHKTSKAA